MGAAASKDARAAQGKAAKATVREVTKAPMGTAPEEADGASCTRAQAFVSYLAPLLKAAGESTIQKHAQSPLQAIKKEELTPKPA